MLQICYPRLHLSAWDQDDMVVCVYLMFYRPERLRTVNTTTLQTSEHCHNNKQNIEMEWNPKNIWSWYRIKLSRYVMTHDTNTQEAVFIQMLPELLNSTIICRKQHSRCSWTHQMGGHYTFWLFSGVLWQCLNKIRLIGFGKGICCLLPPFLSVYITYLCISPLRVFNSEKEVWVVSVVLIN